MTQFPVINSTSTATTTITNGTSTIISTVQQVNSFDPTPVILSVVLVVALAIVAFMVRRKSKGQAPTEVPAQ